MIFIKFIFGLISHYIINNILFKNKILLDDPDAVKWLKARRYEGRTDGMKYHEDMIGEEGWNMYMTPEQAVRGLMLMQNYPENVPDLPEDPPYKDLTEFELFKKVEVR